MVKKSRGGENILECVKQPEISRCKDGALTTDEMFFDSLRLRGG